MATRLKTIEYTVPYINTVTDNTVTALTTITAYIPEFSGTVTFKKCIVMANIHEGATMTTGNYSSRRIDVSVGGAGATSYTNSNLMTGSGENQSPHWAADCTSHFVTNWTTGTSKTVAISILIDSTAATIAWRDCFVTLYITYEYDDQQTTQIKTVWIPLNAPVAALATTKPGTETASIPALDTELPEASKTIRSWYIVVQGNINNTASTTDSSVSMQLDTSGPSLTTDLWEMGATSDYWSRIVWTLKYYDSGGAAAGAQPTTNGTHSFYLWGSIGRFNHAQAYMVVTYEFDASSSNNCFNSVRLPFAMNVMGGTASTDFNRATASLWIEEPATITTKQIAAYVFWEQAATLSGLNMRLGTGSFVTYSDGAAVLCGSNGAMIRNDSSYSLARGLNSFVVDAYRTDTADWGLAVSGFIVVTYTSGKPSGGYGAANHTVLWNTGIVFAAATATNIKSSAFAISIPETNYFINSFGGMLCQYPDSTGTFNGGILLYERTNAAGQWNTAMYVAGHTDTEQGVHWHCFECQERMYRWNGDSSNDAFGVTRLDPEATRRWWWMYSAGSTGHTYLDLMFTYHTITFTASGQLSGYTGDGSGITVTLHYEPTGEKIGSTTTSTGGNYSFTWYDSASSVFAQARQDSTHVGRTDNITAS